MFLSGSKLRVRLHITSAANHIAGKKEGKHRLRPKQATSAGLSSAFMQLAATISNCMLSLPLGDVHHVSNF